MLKHIIGGLIASLALLSFVVQAQGLDTNDKEIQNLQLFLKKLVPNEDPTSIERTPITGLFEVFYGTDVYYLSSDARYMVKGNLIDLQTRENLTEAKKSKARGELVANLSAADMVVFAPENPKYTINVLTDIDCGYCQKLHREIDEYMAEGIAVRYMFYPRAGVGSQSYKKSVAVWCSKDRKQALTDAKAGKQLDEANCANPIFDHMKFAQKIGLRGTPTIVLQSGRVIPGYADAKSLLAELEKDEN